MAGRRGGVLRLRAAAGAGDVDEALEGLLTNGRLIRDWGKLRNKRQRLGFSGKVPL
jgi:hypothetical protein